MAINLHIQNLSVLAANLDVRRFFERYDIPRGGVQILGGPEGDAVVTFRNDIDLLSAISQSGQHLLGQPVTLRIISGNDMERLFDKRKSQFMQATENAKSDSNSGLRQQIKNDGVIPHTSSHYYPGADSNQLHQGDWKVPNLDVHSQGAAMHSYDSHMSGIQQVSSIQTERDVHKINLERVGWEDSQHGISHLPHISNNSNEKKWRQPGPIDNLPGFIRLDHLPTSIGNPEIEDLFDYYKLRIAMPNGIVYTYCNNINSAVIKLVSHHDAIRAEALHQVEMQGCMVNIRLSSERQFHDVQHNNFENDHYNMVPEDHFYDNNFGMIPESPYHYENQPIVNTGCILIDNLPESTRYKELRALFRSRIHSNIGPSAICLKSDNIRHKSAAIIEFSDKKVALRALTLNNTSIEGMYLKIKPISKAIYERNKERWAEEQAERLHKKDLQKVHKSMENVEKPTIPSYIRVHNLPGIVSKLDLRAFFHKHKVPVSKNAIFMKKIEEHQTYTALICLPNDNGAQKAVALNNCILKGQVMRVEKISAKTYNKEKRLLIGEIGSNIQKGVETKKENCLDDSPPGYIMIRNLSPSVKFKDVKAFFRECSLVVARNGIILKVGEHSNSAYVKFSSYQDSLKVNSLDCSALQGDGVEILMSSSKMFEYQQNIIQANDKSFDGHKEQEKKHERQPPNPVDLRSSVTPGDKFECFIKFDQLADDTTASEIWDWFGGAHGVSKGVYVVKQVDNSQAVFGYAAFDNAKHRDVAMAENQPCKAVSAKKAYQHLAEFGPKYRIFEATKMAHDREVLNDQRAGFKQKVNALSTDGKQSELGIFHNMVERVNAKPDSGEFLCFIGVSNVADDTTALDILKKYGRNCKGAVVVRTKDDHNALHTLFACLAFRHLAHRHAALKAVGGDKKWNTKETYEHLASFGPHCNIMECSPSGKYHTVPKQERILLWNNFHSENNRKVNAGAVLKSNSNNLTKEPKLQISQKQSNPQSIFSSLIMGAEAPTSKQLSFLQLSSDSIPEGATASGLCKWLGGPDKISKGGILVQSANGAANGAFVAFEDKRQCKEAMAECEGGFMRTASNIRRCIAAFNSDYKLFESSENGEDNEVSMEKRKQLRLFIPPIIGEKQTIGIKRKSNDLNEKPEEKKLKVEQNELEKKIGLRKEEHPQSANAKAVHMSEVATAKPEEVRHQQLSNTETTHKTEGAIVKPEVLKRKRNRRKKRSANMESQGLGNCG